MAAALKTLKENHKKFVIVVISDDGKECDSVKKAADVRSRYVLYLAQFFVFTHVFPTLFSICNENDCNWKYQ